MTLGTLERILSNLSRSLAPDGDPETLAQQGLLALAEALGARGAWLRLRENGLSLRAAVGVEPPEEARLAPWEAEALSLGRVLAYRLPEEATGPASLRWAELGYRGLMLAPLRGEGGLLGTLALLFAEAPPPGAAAALEEVLPLFGLILQRARAEAELERRQALLEALHRLDRAMLEGKRLVEVAQIGVEAARELLGARAATVSLVEGDQRRLVAAVGEAVEPLVGQSAPLEEGPHAQALRSGEPVLLREIPAEGVPRWLLGLAPLGNLLVLPLKPDGTTVGFLGVYGLSDPSAGLGLARAFAAQLSLALLREQDQEALQQRAKEQEVLLRALQTLGDLENPEEVARLLVELAPELIEAEWAAVLLLEQGVLRVAAASGILRETLGQRVPAGKGISWAAIREGTQIVTQAALDPRIYVPPGTQAPPTGTEVAARLPGPYGEALGVLVVGRTAPAYTPQEARLVEALAQAGAAALERAQHALEARLLLQGALLAAQEEAGRFRSLAELSARLEGLESPEEILEEALEALHRISGFQVACFHQAAPEGLRLLMVAGDPPEAWLHQARREVWPSGRGLRGQTLLTGQALYAPSYPDHPLALPEHIAAGLRCAAYTPVQLSGQIMGVLSLLDFRQTYLDNPLPLLEFAARRLANALEKAETLQQLRQAREEALKGLGVALEYRDLETAGHTERVTRLALRLAEAVRLAGPALTHLRWGAYLHDLGKLAIPDSILKKPGKLEPEEWERMKAHTTLGEEMARLLGFLPQATLQVIRHHHERWDGSGYPDGLAGEAIPLLARVFALADVYDALTSERPYKRAWSHEEALAEIKRQAGRAKQPAAGGASWRLTTGSAYGYPPYWLWPPIWRYLSWGLRSG